MLRSQFGFRSIIVLFSITTALIAVGTGCAHKATKTDEANPAVDTTDYGSSDKGDALGLKTIHFAYDSSTLSSEDKTELQENASILKKNAGVAVQIEGHCDQRGGIQYNIALGERRAVAVKHFLEDQGISKSRITTISYGKEHPLDPSETEEAYAKNRRANFVITKK